MTYSLVKVGFRYTDVLNPWSVQVINTSRKDNLLSCSFSIGNCIDIWIEFTWSISAWNTSEKTVLNKGLNFATTIKRIPNLDLIAPIEEATLNIS